MLKQLLVTLLISSACVIGLAEDCTSNTLEPTTPEDCHNAVPNSWLGQDACCYYERKLTMRQTGQVETMKSCESRNKDGLSYYIKELKDGVINDKNFEFITFDCSSSFLSLSLIVLIGTWF